MGMGKILITADDGIDAPGTLLMAETIMQTARHYDIVIASTFNGASSIGGAISLGQKEIHWGRVLYGEEADVTGIWVKGTPVDAVELVNKLYPDGFDLVLSGLNLGPNLGSAVLSSGTFCAAYRALALELAPIALAVSWDYPETSLWQKNEDEIIVQHLKDTPGRMLLEILQRAIRFKFWHHKFLNINLPQKHTTKMVFTKLAPTIAQSYDYDIMINGDTFKYDVKGVAQIAEIDDIGLDSGALHNGLISVTPCLANLTDLNALKIKNLIST